LLFLRLDSLPLSPQSLFVNERNRAKNMGMATDHLGDDPFERIIGSELIVFGEHGCQHGQDKKDIADFLPNFLRIAILDRLGQLMAFFQKVFF